MKTFKVSQVRALLNQVHQDKITFSRFVEILNNLSGSGIRHDYYTFDEIENAITKGADYYKNHPEDIRNFDYCNASDVEINKYAKDQALGICFLMDKEKNSIINE